MKFAEEEAREYNCDYIGTEHLFLGLTREETATQALKKLNIDPEKINSIARTRAFFSGLGKKPSKKEIKLNLLAGVAVRYAEIWRLANEAKEVTPIHLLIAIVNGEKAIVNRAKMDKSRILVPLAKDRNIMSQLIRLANGLEIDPFIDIAPDITRGLRNVLEDPDISQEVKKRLLNDVTYSIDRAKRGGENTNL